jgi:hypothetical protein
MNHNNGNASIAATVHLHLNGAKLSNVQQKYPTFLLEANELAIQ